jgi:hypothetical protein
VDLTRLSNDDLAILSVEAPRELERRKARREAELLAFIREQMIVLGISPAKLRAALGGRSSPRPPRTPAPNDHPRRGTP